MTDSKTTSQQLKRYLGRLGIEVAIDLTTNRVYIIGVTAPVDVVLPKREGELYFRPGDHLVLI